MTISVDINKEDDGVGIVSIDADPPSLSFLETIAILDLAKVRMCEGQPSIEGIE